MPDSIVFHPYNNGFSHFMDAFPHLTRQPEDIQREEASKILTMLIEQNKRENNEGSGEDA